jgi:hypothetical protein
LSGRGLVSQALGNRSTAKPLPDDLRDEANSFRPPYQAP